MNKRDPMRVKITYSRENRGTFILNGMDITHKVNSCSVQIAALKTAVVTFSVFVDELDVDVEGQVTQP